MRKTIYQCDLCKYQFKYDGGYPICDRMIDLCRGCIYRLARRSMTKDLYDLIYCDKCNGTRSVKEFYFNNDYNLVDCECVKKLKDRRYL